MPEHRYTVTEHDPEKPRLVRGTSRGTVTLDDDRGFFEWAREDWPAPWCPERPCVRVGRSRQPRTGSDLDILVEMGDGPSHQAGHCWCAHVKKSKPSGNLIVRCSLARDHPRAIRIVLGDREAVLAHQGRTYVRMAVKGA